VKIDQRHERMNLPCSAVSFSRIAVELVSSKKREREEKEGMGKGEKVEEGGMQWGKT
jgi:hypothetical protein